MFVKKIKLAGADKIFSKKEKVKLDKLRVKFIPYADEKYWDRPTWKELVHAKTLNASEGFYVPLSMFNK